MRLTFEGSTLEDIFTQMGKALGYDQAPSPAQPSSSNLGEQAATAAKTASKQLDAKDAPPPTPAVKKILDEAGIPENEYHLIDRHGKGNKMTQTDAKAYVAARAMKRAEENPPKASPARDFPASSSPPALQQEGEPASAAQETPSGPAAETPTEPSDEAPAFTFNEVKSKLTKLNSERGMGSTIATLARFGVERISALREEQYSDFMAFADKVIAKEINPVTGEGSE